MTLTKSSPPLVLVSGEGRWSDEQLLLGVRGGHPGAARALYDQLRPLVDRALRRVLRGRYRDFDDLVQTSFEHILRGIVEDRFAGRSALGTWASAIAAHVALDALRRHGRDLRRTDDDAVVADLELGPRTDGALEARAELRKIHDVLSRMNPDQAETLVLHDVLGHPLEEIASMRRSGLSATQSRLRRARAELTRRAAAWVGKTKEGIR